VPSRAVIPGVAQPTCLAASTSVCLLQATTLHCHHLTIAFSRTIRKFSEANTAAFLLCSFAHVEKPVLLCEPSKDNFGLPVSAETKGYQAQLRNPSSQLFTFTVSGCLLQLLFSHLRTQTLHRHTPQVITPCFNSLQDKALVTPCTSPSNL
jgi:hypothetical protein